MSDQPPREWKYLGRKPCSNYRQLYITGTKFAARQLYAATLSNEDGPGMTVEEVAADFNVPVEAVREAIAYCESNPPEIRQDWEMDEALADAMGMNDPNYKLNPKTKVLSAEERARIYRR